MADTTVKVSVLDLTVEQVETIEREVGVPVNRWGSGVTSIADLYSRILAAAKGEDIAKYKAMTMRDLIAQVSIDGEEDDNP